ncbi:MAG TPA: alkaline phosphatase family protein [Armatimonadota bacterium]|nr:alkaline phosphatase family protein [Armatimonadota bacterium]
MTAGNQDTTPRRPQLLLLGIDGATWDVMDPLLQAGELPNIAAVVQSGLRHPLRSTNPPFSPCAWGSLMTGVNPGRHGIIGWYDLVTRVPFSARDLRSPAIWDLVSRAGLSVGVLNIPTTWPASAVNGFMVSGEIGTIDYDERMFYPRELFEEARREVPDYPLCGSEAESRYYGWPRLRDNAASRLTLASYLLRNHPVDVFVSNVNYVDLAQHKHFRTWGRGEDQDVVSWAYRAADHFVGSIREVAGADVPVILVSDHGGGPIEGYLNVPALLRDLGLLKMRRSTLSRRVIWPLRRIAQALLRRSSLLKRTRVLEGVRRKLSGHAFDWANTIAYMIPASGGVALNTEGRTPRAAVALEDRRRVAELVAAAIRGTVNPITGERDIEAVLTDDVYEGPWTSSAPEVLLTPRNYTYCVVNAGPDKPEAFMTPEQLTQRYPEHDMWQGIHRADGIFVASGPGVESADVGRQADVMDVTPTALAMLGIEAPEGTFDGQPLVRTQSPTRVQLTGDDLGAATGADGRPDYSEDEVAQVRQRLRDLGYL